MTVVQKTSMVCALLLGLLTAGSPAQAADPSITVSAAISLREALNAIADNWTKSTGTKVQINFGASGTLMSQIEAGAPVDLFVSAGAEQVDELIAKSLADKTTRRIVVGNSLVLIVPPDSQQPPTKFTDLTDARFKHIAVGQPQAVPAGTYAMQVFKSLSIDGAVKDRLVFGTNVRQVLDYVQHGEADAGVVYSTDALSAAGQVKVVATADASWHEPIVYPAVVIKGSASAEEARKFLEALTTSESAAIFRAHGFTAGADLSTTAPATQRTTAP